MDPLATAASIAGFIQLAAQVLAKPGIPTDFLDTTNLFNILLETNQQFLLQSQHSPSIAKLVGECYSEWEQLSKLMGKTPSSSQQATWRGRFATLVRLQLTRDRRRAALARFRDSVLLLHQVASSSSIKHDLELLKQENTLLKFAFSEASYPFVENDPLGTKGKQSDSSARPVHKAQTSGPEISKDGIKDTKAFILALLEEHFTLDAIITTIGEDGELKKTATRGILDTGCEKFLINEELVRRAHVTESALEPVTDDIVLKGLGDPYKPIVKTKLTWHVVKHMNSREDEFYVIPKAPFDIVIPHTMLIGSRHVAASPTAPLEVPTLLLTHIRMDSATREQANRRHEEQLSEADNISRDLSDSRRLARQTELARRERSATASAQSSIMFPTEPTPDIDSLNRAPQQPTPNSSAAQRGELDTR